MEQAPPTEHSAAIDISPLALIQKDSVVASTGGLEWRGGAKATHAVP